MIKRLLLCLGLLMALAVHAASPTWQVDPTKYEFAMQVVCIVKTADGELKNASDKLGAFVGNNCRGTTTPIYIDAIKRNVYYLTIMSNTASGETIAFKIYDAAADQLHEAHTTIKFEVNKNMGSAMNPVIISTEELRSEIVLNVINFKENMERGHAVANLTTWYAGEKVNATYSLQSGAEDNASFSVSGNTLQGATSFNYEQKNTFVVRVKATLPSDVLEDTFHLSLADVNEAPTAIVLSRTAINENEADNAEVATLTATDQDQNDAHTFTLINGSALFGIQGNKLLQKQGLNYEQAAQHNITLKVEDAQGAQYEQDVVIAVNDVNDAPQALALTGDSVTVGLPKGIPVGVCAATDEDDADVVSLSLPTGALDNDAFYLADNGLLTTAKTFAKAEVGNMVIRLQAMDKSGAKVQKDIPISVADKGYTFEAEHITITFSKSDYVVRNSNLNGHAVNLEVIPLGTHGLFEVRTNYTMQYYHVYDANGKYVANKTVGGTSFQLDLSGYSTGMYFLNVQTIHGTLYEKINIHFQN